MKTNFTKTETHYAGMLITDNPGIYEDFCIVQEADGRGAIKLSIYPERWRTPEDTVKMLEGIIECLKKNFT